MPETIISASILNSDLSMLSSAAQKVRDSGVDWLHLDVMDGNFVKEITIGASVLASLRQHSDMFFDVHLMVRYPYKQLKLFADAGANSITFHAESRLDGKDLIKKIHSLGCRAGIAIKPKTPVERIEPFIAEADMVLVMTVEPGYGGQGFIHETLEKIRQVRRLCPDKDIEVDGGINADTVKLVKKAGANVLVAGTYLMRAENMRDAAETLRKA